MKCLSTVIYCCDVWLWCQERNSRLLIITMSVLLFHHWRSGRRSVEHLLFPSPPPPPPPTLHSSSSFLFVSSFFSLIPFPSSPPFLSPSLPLLILTFLHLHFPFPFFLSSHFSRPLNLSLFPSFSLPSPCLTSSPLFPSFPLPLQFSVPFFTFHFPSPLPSLYAAITVVTRPGKTLGFH